MHRIAVLIKKIGQTPVIHDNLVSLIWNILVAGNAETANQLHKSKDKYRPYVWATEEWPNSDGYTVTFSSIKPEITNIFLEGCKAIQQEGTAITINANLYQIQAIIPIKDMHYIGKSITVRSCSPIITSTKKNNIKKYLLYHADPDFYAQRLTDNLRRRTKAFFGEEPEAQINIIHPGVHVHTEYKGTKIPGRQITAKITGSPEAIKTVIYGGLGERTGSGFGMVIPI